MFSTRGWRLSFGVTRPEGHRVGVSVLAVMVSITTFTSHRATTTCARPFLGKGCSRWSWLPWPLPSRLDAISAVPRRLSLTGVSLLPPNSGRTRGGPLGLACGLPRRGRWPLEAKQATSFWKKLEYLRWTPDLTGCSCRRWYLVPLSAVFPVGQPSRGLPSQGLHGLGPSAARGEGPAAPAHCGAVPHRQARPGRVDASRRCRVRCAPAPFNAHAGFVFGMSHSCGLATPDALILFVTF